MTSNRKKRTHTAATTTKVSRRSPVLIVGRRFTRSPSSVRIATTISRKRTRYLLGNPGGSFSASWPYSTSFIGGSSAGENGAFARAAALFSSFPLRLGVFRASFPPLPLPWRSRLSGRCLFALLLCAFASLRASSFLRALRLCALFLHSSRKDAKAAKINAAVLLSYPVERGYEIKTAARDYGNARVPLPDGSSLH